MHRAFPTPYRHDPNPLRPLDADVDGAKRHEVKHLLNKVTLCSWADLSKSISAGQDAKNRFDLAAMEFRISVFVKNVVSS